VGETGFPASADLRLDTKVTKKSRFFPTGSYFLNDQKVKVYVLFA